MNTPVCIRWSIIWGMLMMMLAVFSTPALGQDAKPAASGPDRVTLTNGDILTGRVVEQSEAQVVIEHAVLGAVAVPRAKVAGVLLAGEEATAAAPAVAPAPSVAAPAPAEAVIPEKPVKLGLLGTNFMKGWNRHFEAGVNGSSGNTESFNVNLAANFDYEDDTDRWKWTNSYFRSSSDGDLSRNEFTSEVLKDWLIPDAKHFYFANGKYEFDDFQGWEHRSSGFGGIGYEFIKRDQWDLRGRAGLGGNYEFGDVNEFTPEALLGLETSWQITERQKLTAATTWYPALDELGQFRNVNTLAYVIAIDPQAGMSLKLGLEHEHQSNPPQGNKKNDLKYLAALVFDF
jgi:putative salt-induced outer membrane protein YdiY